MGARAAEELHQISTIGTGGQAGNVPAEELGECHEGRRPALLRSAGAGPLVAPRPCARGPCGAYLLRCVTLGLGIVGLAADRPRLVARPQHRPADMAVVPPRPPRPRVQTGRPAPVRRRLRENGLHGKFGKTRRPDARAGSRAAWPATSCRCRPGSGSRPVALGDSTPPAGRLGPEASEALAPAAGPPPTRRRSCRRGSVARVNRGRPRSRTPVRVNHTVGHTSWTDLRATRKTAAQGLLLHVDFDTRELFRRPSLHARTGRRYPDWATSAASCAAVIGSGLFAIGPGCRQLRRLRASRGTNWRSPEESRRRRASAEDPCH